MTTASVTDTFELLYREVNKQALAPFFASCLHADDIVLDAGCGQGDLAKRLRLSHPYCIDLDLEQLNKGRSLRTVELCAQGDLQYLPFENNTFDAVICSNVLHYTGSSALNELQRVTKPNGLLLLAFLEKSNYTRWVIELSISWGLFPAFMRDVPLFDISYIEKMDMTIEDSFTVMFLPPMFMTSKAIPRKGFVVYVLRKVVLN
jgi:ubiquinone/menaquinone biosynthesis C-methylase UbiE